MLRHLAEKKSWCRHIVELVYSPLPQDYVDELDASDAADICVGRKQGLRCGTFSGRAKQLPGPRIKELYDASFMTSLGYKPLS